MAQLPTALTLLSNLTNSPHGHRNLLNLLLATILHLQEEGEEEALILTENDVLRASSYSLVVTVMQEDHAVVLTARPK